MRLITFLSKFTFICNIAFLLFIFFRWMEMQKHVKGSTDQLITVPFVENIIVVLGFCAIIINLLMNLIYLILLATGRIKRIASWLVLINFLFLLLQLFYFFFYN